jgi:excisionase family DNA binding protein
MSDPITTSEAAKRLKVSDRRIRQLVLWGELPATKFGRDYQIKLEDLKNLKRRKVGRPKKK